MALDIESRARFNLKSATIMLVETPGVNMDILSQILMGFGAKAMHRCDSAVEARAAIGRTEMDLMLISPFLADECGYELVQWIRRDAPDPNKFAPIIMVSPHTEQSKVARARDCGAHFLVAKPLTPAVILERILWVARSQRPFVACDSYVGPERRFKFEGPPATGGRRRDDLPETVGAAVEPNMSQDQIDALMAPRKVAI